MNAVFMIYKLVSIYLSYIMKLLSTVDPGFICPLSTTLCSFLIELGNPAIVKSCLVGDKMAEG